MGLPFSYWHHFVLEEKFGFNKQTVGLWLTDLVKGQALSLAFGIPIGAAFFRIIQATGDKVSLLFSVEAEVGLMLEDACCWLLLRRFSTTDRWTNDVIYSSSSTSGLLCSWSNSSL